MSESRQAGNASATLTGQMLIGGAAVQGDSGEWRAMNPATGEWLLPVYRGGGPAVVGRACELAWTAFDSYRETTLTLRAGFLEKIATNILECGDELIQRAMLETGLPRARLEGERGRTVAQLRLFAEVVREGSFVEARIDPAMADRKPLPRSDLRQRHVAVGPVAVFGASNFPLAFSVAGGDTAAALAAGCPVIVKAHSAHPGTSELVGRAVQRAVADCQLPEGVFSLLFGSGVEVGAALVAHPRISAVGFTGSRSGGTALMAIAARRPEPIPVYAEMSSINPVYLLAGALDARAEQIGRDFVASMTLGAGQFCTNPGLIVAIAGPALEQFVAAASSALAGSTAATMLTAGIHGAYCAGVEKLALHPSVKTLARGQGGPGANQTPAALFAVDAQRFLADAVLHEEVFGAASLLVRCRDFAELYEVAESLAGQLTATLQIEPQDWALAGRLIPVLERKAGRIVVNGFPTGVEVSHAMVHGGPFPATSDGRSTSVGSLAIRRFLRPVCYQDMPADLLPAALVDANPLQVWRRWNGELGKQ
jgi:alpha-ketoglutaric semialdehyde dehydrogenase